MGQFMVPETDTLVRAEGVSCPWLLAQTEGGHYFGPSGVSALPLAAGINEGGHYFRYLSSFFFFFFLPPLFKTTEGVVVGFQIFAWAPKKNNTNSGNNIKFGPPPPGPLG
jgi:hypothetical protein